MRHQSLLFVPSFLRIAPPASAELVNDYVSANTSPISGTIDNPRAPLKQPASFQILQFKNSSHATINFTSAIYSGSFN